MTLSPDPQWYKKIWTLNIQDMSWTERTEGQIAFLVDLLGLQGHERILDLACGFGRHTLALARRGHPVVGVDITAAYVEEARRQAAEDGLDAQFLCADLRDVYDQNPSFRDASLRDASLRGEFDVVLNLADGAIGYLETDSENLKIFDLVATALKPGGKHVMEVCSGDYAQIHFPHKSWEAGSRALSLAEFEWEAETSRMLYTGYTFPYGEPLAAPQGHAPTSTRLYTLAELREILATRGMRVCDAFGGYDRDLPASQDQFTLLVYSEKHRQRPSRAN